MMFIIWFVVALTFHSNIALAQGKNLTSDVEYLEDVQGSLTIDQVINGHDLPFQHWQTSGDINLGFTQSTYWFRFTLTKDPNDVNINKFLLIPFITLQHVEFYAHNQPTLLAGANHPFESRVWPHRYFVFPIQLLETPQTYYLKIQTNTAMTVPLSIWNPDDFAEETQVTYLGLGVYYGEMIALMLYNLLIFLYLKENSFLLYALFAMSMGLSMLFGNGVGQQYLWSYSLFGLWESQFTTGLYALTLTTAIAFARSFLQINQISKRLDNLLSSILWAGFVIFVSAFLTDQAWVAEGSAIVIMFGTLLILWAGMFAHYHGNPSAIFFVLPWSILCLGAFISGLRSFDWIETNIITANSVQLSSAVEMLLLSFALAHRIKLEKESKVQMQQMLVNTLKDSEAKLEKTVIARTEALKKSLHHEQETLEKFIRFGAYISHEFRNPLAIIKNQCVTLQKELTKNINTNTDKRLTSILTASDRISNLFENWLHSDRLRQGSVILSITEINAHQFLNSLVQQCQHLYQDHPISYIPNEDTQITFNGDEDMIRIAMINLIDNAVKYSPNATPIQIQMVFERSSQLGIMVKDQGNGMNLSEHPHLFQDYFRLDGDKSKTKGFGLGLGFVSKICELHNGSVTVNSELGKGSQFCIWLSREHSKK